MYVTWKSAEYAQKDTLATNLFEIRGMRTTRYQITSEAFSHFLMVLLESVVRLAISLIDKCSRKNIRRIMAYMTMVITSFTPAYKIGRIMVLPSPNIRITALIW